jgi:two-component system OmpR family response regulator
MVREGLSTGPAWPFYMLLSENHRSSGAMVGNRVLIIEDDDGTAGELGRILDGAGMPSDRAATLDDGIARANAAEYRLIILDRMLPGGDGLDIIPRLRGEGRRVAVMVLSALGRTANRVEGLDRGADDYLAKPFEPEELIARARAMLRRTAGEPTADLITYGDIEIHTKARTVHRRGRYIALSPKEFKLMKTFADHAGEVLTRMMLLERVWNLHFDPQTNVVDVHVGRLRRKLEAAGEPPVIRTERGSGYIFEPAD